ncbi:MAG: MCE family protein [Planctomycetaceae bacterium]|nr:MCE family protein [Planctomycetaceae bacterium]
MDERQLRFRVGVVVVAAAIILVILITLLGAWPNPFTPRNTLHIVFPAAPGVTVDTPVRKSGIEIGRVSKLELRERGGVLVTLKINAKYPLRFNEVCRISTGSLVTGDAVLEFVPSADPTLSDEFLPDEVYLTNGTVETNPFEIITNMEGEIKAALDSVKTAGDEITTFARSVNSLMGTKDDQLGRIVDKTELALENFNRAMSSIDSVLGNQELKDRLHESLDKVPVMFDQAQHTLSEFQNTLSKFNGVAMRAERNLANLEDFTAPLGERGEEISRNLAESMKSVNELLANFAELSASLKNKEGTIGQLINNPELYNRLLRTVAEAETLIRRLEPIVNDVRVITDKVARDPAQFGVKAIFDRRPPGAGTKFPVYPDEQSTVPGRLGDARLGSPLR